MMVAREQRGQVMRPIPINAVDHLSAVQNDRRIELALQNNVLGMALGVTPCHIWVQIKVSALAIPLDKLVRQILVLAAEMVNHVKNG